jgi:L-lactate dehydrogenase complex protein LldG
MRREDMSDLYPRFHQRLTAVGGECYHAGDLAEAAAIIAAHDALAQKEIVIPPRFCELRPWGTLIPLLRDKGIRVREAESAAGVADAPAGLSAALLAVAETGSVLLAENALEARIVGMLTLTHFVLVRSEDLVAMLDDMGARLPQLTQSGMQQQHYISLVTGPSRTADIERTLTVGVQGPKALCVLVVSDQKAEL